VSLSHCVIVSLFVSLQAGSDSSLVRNLGSPSCVLAQVPRSRCLISIHHAHRLLHLICSLTILQLDVYESITVSVTINGFQRGYPCRCSICAGS
jgi:hypothetical protein